MNWYITKVVFRVSENDGPEAGHFDEQLRLVAAVSKEEAFLKARTLGLNLEDMRYYDSKKVATWEFINVSEVAPLQNLDDGIALYSRIHKTKEAGAYISVIHQKAIAIRMDACAAQ
jgi:hypothetical protein